MLSDLHQVAHDALREIYAEAEPGLDFDHLVKNPGEYDEDWYSQHFLDAGRQNEILDKHCNEAGLSDSERAPVSMTVILHYGPLGHVRPEEDTE